MSNVAATQTSITSTLQTCAALSSLYEGGAHNLREGGMAWRLTGVITQPQWCSVYQYIRGTLGFGREGVNVYWRGR